MLHIFCGSWSITSYCCCCYCCSVAKWCLTLCNPMDCSTSGFPVLHYLPEFAQIYAHWVDDAIYLILCHPLLLLPSIFPSIRFFSSESPLCSSWPKYWNFSFSISPSNEYSGLISYRIYWFDLLAVQGTLRSLLQYHSSKSSILHHSAFQMIQLSRVRVGSFGRLSDEELMILNCGIGVDSWESLGLQGDQTSKSYRKSTLNIHWKD